MAPNKVDQSTDRGGIDGDDREQERIAGPVAWRINRDHYDQAVGRSGRDGPQRHMGPSAGAQAHGNCVDPDKRVEETFCKPGSKSGKRCKHGSNSLGMTEGQGLTRLQQASSA